MDKIQKIYNIKKVTSGKRVEFYKYSCFIREGKESNNKTGRRGKDTVNQEQKEVNREISKKQTLTKARNKIVRLVSCNQEAWQTFITLTYKDNMQDISKSKEHIKKFFKKLQQDYKELMYLYVIEFQDRGAIHYHILTNIKFDIPLNDGKQYKSQDHKDLEKWFAKKYWSNRGFIDIKDIKNNSEIRNISKYISAYMVEDLFKVDLKGNKSHGYSRNLKKPIVEKISDTSSKVEDFINKEGTTQYINSYEVEYKDKNGNRRGGVCNYFDNLKD